MGSISLIVAVDKNGAIGRNGEMPWHLPADLARFRKLTWGKPIIMGRKTFDSIGRALPGRRNVVVTRNSDWKAMQAERASTFPDALSLCAGSEEIMVIGGASIYREALPLANIIYLTCVDAEVEGDVYFPKLSEDGWERTSFSHYPIDERNRYAMDFLTLVRRAAN